VRHEILSGWEGAANVGRVVLRSDVSVIIVIGGGGSLPRRVWKAGRVRKEDEERRLEVSLQ